MFDSIRTIPVRVRPPYDVRIGSGLLGRCGDYLAALLGQRRIAVLADDTVATVSPDGTVTGLKAGTTKLTVKAAAMPSVSTTVDVTVTAG